MGQPVQDVTTRRNSAFNKLQCLLRNTHAKLLHLQCRKPSPWMRVRVSWSGLALKSRAWMSTSSAHPSFPSSVLKMSTNGRKCDWAKQGSSFLCVSLTGSVIRSCPGSHLGQERIWSMNIVVRTLYPGYMTFRSTFSPTSSLSCLVTSQAPSYLRLN